MSVLQRDWFSQSGSKQSTVSQVESMLTAVRDVSQPLLEHIVNMTDQNVSSIVVVVVVVVVVSSSSSSSSSNSSISITGVISEPLPEHLVVNNVFGTRYLTLACNFTFTRERFMHKLVSYEFPFNPAKILSLGPY